MPPLNPSAVPEALLGLLPLAERWGIGDDVERSLAVEQATADDRQALVTAVVAAPDELWEWLVQGPQSQEWAAFTCMTQAADEARVTDAQLRLRNDSPR